MPTYVFPVEIEINEELKVASEAQDFCVSIENILGIELSDYGIGQVICLSPIKGMHRRTTVDKENS